MGKPIRLKPFSTLMILASLAAYAVDENRPASKLGSYPPSNISIQKNKELIKYLPFDDQQDFKDANKGFIDGPIELVTKNARGQITNDLEAYSFVTQLKEAPDSVNPSLWRQARLNMARDFLK